MIIYIIGAPGSGKGTLCQKWCSDTGFKHLSLGDHLRYLVKSGSTAIDAQSKDRILKNELIETHALLPILKRARDELIADGAPGIVIDGFPRDVHQAIAAEDVLGNPDMVIYFVCPREIAERRYMTRSLPGRDHDINIFEKRFEEFSRLNDAVVQRYEQTKNLFKVDSSGETERSYDNLLCVMSTRLPRQDQYCDLSTGTSKWSSNST